MGTMIKHHDVRIDRSLIHPRLDYKLTKLLKKCEENGIWLIITEGFRTKEYQDSLYAKGRTAPGNIVTNARGSSYSSQHMWGIAFDIAINDKNHLYDGTLIAKVAKLAKSIGLGWGGDWKSFKDTPHFYLTSWGSTASVLRAQYGTPENFKRTWKKKVSRNKGLILWKNVAKTKKITRIPSSTVIPILYSKLWYSKVLYNGHVGFVNSKFLV